MVLIAAAADDGSDDSAEGTAHLEQHAEEVISEQENIHVDDKDHGHSYKRIGSPTDEVLYCVHSSDQARNHGLVRMNSQHQNRQHGGVVFLVGEAADCKHRGDKMLNGMIDA